MGFCEDYLWFYLGQQYNKYYNFRNFCALSFFNGKRFMLARVILRSILLHCTCCLLAMVQTEISCFGIWIANKNCSSPCILVWYFGTLLLPFGLHHGNPNELYSSW